MADLGPLHEIYADRETMRWIGAGEEHSRDVEESSRRLERLIEHHERHGFGFWAVTERDSGTVLGDAGLILYARKGPEIELGYRLGKPYWGKGYATEAGAAWVAYGFDELDLERILSVTHPENEASQRVLGKLGFAFDGIETDYFGVEVCRYALDRRTYAVTRSSAASQSRTNRSSA